MIARAWSGRTRPEDADAYTAYLGATGVRDCLDTAGNRGVLVLLRLEGEAAEFRFVSFWESMEAIRAFAGTEPERARYYEKDPEYLLELEPTVEHFEVAFAEFPDSGPDAPGSTEEGP